MTQDYIHLEGIRIFTNHGCLPEEALIGSEYEVDLKVWANLSDAAKSDHLKQTVDYVALNQIVFNEMQQRSKLLEHVAQRVIDKIFNDLEQVEKVEVRVTKLLPPINGDVARVSVNMLRDRADNP